MEFKNDVYGKRLADILESKPKRQPTIGDKLIPFQLPDSLGQQISSSQFGKKVLLIDFWGSGCGPCREEHKNYFKVYERFSSLGFEIVSLSIDSRREAWVKAMKKDKMIWTSLWDQGHAVADKFRVNALPTNFLVNENGTIIGTDLRGGDLVKAVEAVLDGNKVENKN